MTTHTRIAVLLAGGLLLAAGAAQAEGGYVASGGARLLYAGSAADDYAAGLELGRNNGVGAFGSVGYRWEDGFSTEIEGGMRGRAVDSAAEDETGRGAAQSTALLMVNARISPKVRGPLRPYAGVGAGVALVNTQDYGMRSDRDDVAPAGQALAGFSLDVSDRTSLFAEYRYLKLLDDVGPDAASSGHEESHAGFIGLRVRLGDMNR